MKTSKIIALVSTVLVLGTALIIYAPTAVAQNAAGIACSKAKEDSDGVLKGGRLPPEIGAYKVDLVCTVSMPQTTGVCPASTMLVEFETEKLPDGGWGKMSFSPASQTKPIPATTGSAATDIGPFTSTVTIVTTRKAPAFITGEYVARVKATPSGTGAQGGCYVAPAVPAKITFNLVNDYFPVMEYQPAKYSQKTGQNKDVIFSIKVTNFGNGDTKVNAAPAIWVSKGKLESVIPPSQITLETKVLSDKAIYTKDIVVSAKTPHSNGYTNSIYTFSMTFTASSVQGGGSDLVKDDQTVTLSVQVQGVYVPGFDPTMAIAALGVAMLLIGMARRRM